MAKQIKDVTIYEISSPWSHPFPPDIGSLENFEFDSGDFCDELNKNCCFMLSAVLEPTEELCSPEASLLAHHRLRM